MAYSPPNVRTRTTGTLTAVAQTVVLTGADLLSAALIAINGTYIATVIFEGSDDGGTTWYTLTATRTDSNTQESTSGSLTNITRAWKMGTSGFNQIRARCSAYTSGTVNVAVTGTNMPVEAAPSAGGVNTAQLAGTAIDVNSGVKSAGTQRVVLATDQVNLTTALNVSTAQIAGTATAVNSGVLSAGVQRVTLATDQVALTTPMPVQPKVGTTGGSTPHHLVAAGTTNATSVKGSAGTVYGWTLTNTAAAVKFVKLFNKATAPTTGTDTPTVTVMIPAGQTVSFAFAAGIAFGTGIGLAITNLAADLDNTAVTAGDVISNVFWN